MLDQKKEGGKRDASTKQEDYFRQFRTNVVIFWFASNAALIYIMTADKITSKIFPSLTETGVHPYLTGLFWSIAALSVIRFIFSTLYLFQFAKDKSASLITGRSA